MPNSKKRVQGSPRYRSHGTGVLNKKKLASLGKGVVFEAGVRVFHPQNIQIGSYVYIGHDTILHGYHKNIFSIADNVWIGPQCYFHAAGGLEVASGVGIGPGVRVLTSAHDLGRAGDVILDAPLAFHPVVIESGADIGAGAVLLPGVRIGRGAQVGAGAVVAKDVAPFSVVAGNPARQLRVRTHPGGKR